MVTFMFKLTGPLLIYCLDKGKTISAQTYIEDFLKPIVSAIEKQLPTSGSKYLKILHKNANNINYLQKTTAVNTKLIPDET